ncbi:MAG: B12-binding domain-containing radical SAM protein [Marinilabiliales bacterium]|nr:MAG: B12-binding domain-containing radical SAM protein [Marinilabiliales bacterium]
MKKLILINPRNLLKKGLLKYIDSKFPPLGLGIIAALTPKDWEIEIIDENFDDFEFKQADLVGFTAFTSNAYRAYQIASVYKEKGITTIMGGIHATMCSDEALQYMDVVVKGEAESVWLNVIRDFENGEIKQLYEGPRLSAENIPSARHDLFHDNYMFSSVQTTRGCPWTCDFCSVTAFNGTAYRQRDTEVVLDEIEQTKGEKLLFVDDNLIGYSKKSVRRTIDLLKGMKKRGINKQWFTQASINIADNDEVLQLMADTNCKMVLIGIEAEKLDALIETNKSLNEKVGVENYNAIFDKLHSYGIGVLGTLIFGLDTDTADDLRRRVKWIIESKIDAFQTSVLTPFPGTGTYKKMLLENRIRYNNFPSDWQRMRFFENVIHPAKMTHDELNDVLKEVWSELFSEKTILKKFIMTLKETKNRDTAIWTMVTNTNYGNAIFEDIRFFNPATMLQ